MTSIHYQYNRTSNGTNNVAPSSNTNKATSSVRGRTESPGIRNRYQRLTTASTQNSDLMPPNRTSRQTPSRNPPERISANPVEQQRQYNNKVNAITANYLNKTGLINNNNNQSLTPRRTYKTEDQTSLASKIKQQQASMKQRSNDFETSSQHSTKTQKNLTNYSNLKQSNYNLEENFQNSLNLSRHQNQMSGYNIITHETNDRYVNKSSIGNVNGTTGSLLKAAQNNYASNGTSSQFYPAQQQVSYKIPTLPSTSSVSSNSSSVNNQSPSHNYYNTNIINTTNTTHEYSDNHELSSRGMVGLKNLGNTCFMNCVLQCLNNTKCLMEYCLSNAYQSEINTNMSVMKGSLFNSYASLVKQMWGGGAVVSLQDFKNQLARFAPRFVGYAQQDAEEFLSYLIKGLHEDVNLVRKRPSPFKFDEKAWDRMSDTEKSQEHWSMNLRTDNSRISDMFVGQLKSTLKCTKCDYKSPTFELFWQLAVPIPKLATTRLDDCIKLFMAEEILDGDNKPTCSRCNEKRRCTKRYTIERLPKILVIHLKRFLKVRYNNKINANVDYPIESLDMSKYLSHNVDPSSSRPSSTNSHCIYDLHGICLHSGTESSGHYVAYCKHPIRKKWNYFNDLQVREISKNSLQDSNAYILFYQLRN